MMRFDAPRWRREQQMQATMNQPQAKHTPGAWQIRKSFNGYVVTRVWSSGFLQRMRTPHLRTQDEARAAIAAYTGVSA